MRGAALVDEHFDVGVLGDQGPCAPGMIEMNVRQQDLRNVANLDPPQAEAPA
jgi:hypothetical protein